MKPIDISGQTFGLLTAVKLEGRNQNRQALWSFLCACGNSVTKEASRVKSGHATSCGCQAVNQMKSMVGLRFGRLTVASLAGKSSTRAYVWSCLCDCGSLAVVDGTKLRSGHTHSCGCLQIEAVAGLNRSHGMTDHPLYSVWQGMRSRTNNPNHKDYAHYGGRGIKVCERWGDFKLFVSDMGPRPDGLTLDRINNDRGYEPGNCRWATNEEQNNNKRFKALS